MIQLSNADYATLVGERDAQSIKIARLQAQVYALANAKLSNNEIDACADMAMEPIDTSDTAEEAMDRAVLRSFARTCIGAALAKAAR